MAHTKLIPSIVVVAVAAVAPRAARAGSIHHFPPAEAPIGQAIAVEARVTRAWDATLTLHYRAAQSDATWTAEDFARGPDGGDDWSAVIPAEVVASPGVEYYIDAIAAGGAAAEPQFASAAHPHVVHVRLSASALRRERDLTRLHDRRSRVHVATEWIDYGARTIGADQGVPDRYLRVDADFAYRLLAYPLEQIRVGYTGFLAGQVPDLAAGACRPAAAACAKDAGFRVGGWFELRFGVVDGLAVDARAMVMATQAGFGVGGRGELRFGYEDGNHVAIGVEGIQAVGTTGFLRLGWATVPGLPMAATVEVTDFPSIDRPSGVRFVYDVAHPLPSGLRIGGRIGYQARDTDIGAASLGATMSFDF